MPFSEKTKTKQFFTIYSGKKRIFEKQDPTTCTVYMSGFCLQNLKSED